jgi:hypothetical protein
MFDHVKFGVSDYEKVKPSSSRRFVRLVLNSSMKARRIMVLR